MRLALLFIAAFVLVGLVVAELIWMAGFLRKWSDWTSAGSRTWADKVVYLAAGLFAPIPMLITLLLVLAVVVGAQLYGRP